MDSPSQKNTVSAKDFSAREVAAVMIKAKTPRSVAYAQALALDYLARDPDNETVLSAGSGLKRMSQALELQARSQAA